MLWLLRGQQSLGDRMKIDVTSSIDAAMAGLLDFEKKQVPFAASKTINDLAYEISRNVMPKEADSTFEGRATQFTKRGFKYSKSSRE